MPRSLALLAILFVAACASEADGPDPLPTACSLGDRAGTYLFTYTEVSGSCGPLDSQVVSLNPGPGGAGAGCTLNSERISEGDCKVERDLTCDTPSGSVRTVGVSRQQTQDGSVIDGTITFNLMGRTSCTGTYRTHAVRQ